MASTIDIFIPNKSKRDVLGRYITAFKGLKMEAIDPPPNNPRVREHEQPIPRLRTPNEYNGAFIERYEEQEPCCDECDPPVKDEAPDYPYYAPVYVKVPTLPTFEQIEAQALAFPERYELQPGQLLEAPSTEDGEGDPDDGGLAAKKLHDEALAAYKAGKDTESEEELKQNAIASWAQYRAVKVQDAATFREEEHSRGQPENKGQFTRKGAGVQSSPPVGSPQYNPETTRNAKGEAQPEYNATERVSAFITKRTGPATPSATTSKTGGFANSEAMQAIEKRAVPEVQPTAPTSRALVAAKPDRSDLPEHIKKLVLPPAWTGVHYHPNPEAELLAIGTDAAGRKQYVYSEKYAAAQSAIEFARVRELEQKLEAIHTHNEQNRLHDVPVIRDVADATKLIMETGIRPGSDTDTKAKVKAYGATTLLGSHVQADVNGVSLKFTGKKGVPLDIPISDPETAEMLRYRAQRAGPSGKLFPSTDDKKLQGYIKQLSGGDFKPKDMRTHVANSTAMGAMRMLPQPKNMTQYKKQVHEVAKRVSRKLGNTPTVALASYINPDVFTPWRTGLQE